MVKQFTYIQGKEEIDIMINSFIYEYRLKYYKNLKINVITQPVKLYDVHHDINVTYPKFQVIVDFDAIDCSDIEIENIHEDLDNSYNFVIRVNKDNKIICRMFDTDVTDMIVFSTLYDKRLSYYIHDDELYSKNIRQFLFTQSDCDVDMISIHNRLTHFVELYNSDIPYYDKVVRDNI